MGFQCDVLSVCTKDVFWFRRLPVRSTSSSSVQPLNSAHWLSRSTLSWCRGQIEFRYTAVMKRWGDAVWLQDHCAAAGGGDDDDDDSCNEGSEWRWRQWHRWEDHSGYFQRLVWTQIPHSASYWVHESKKIFITFYLIIYLNQSLFLLVYYCSKKSNHFMSLNILFRHL